MHFWQGERPAPSFCGAENCAVHSGQHQGNQPLGGMLSTALTQIHFLFQLRRGGSHHKDIILRLRLRLLICRRHCSGSSQHVWRRHGWPQHPLAACSGCPLLPFTVAAACHQPLHLLCRHCRRPCGRSYHTGPACSRRALRTFTLCCRRLLYTSPSRNRCSSGTRFQGWLGCWLCCCQAVGCQGGWGLV